MINFIKIKINRKIKEFRNIKYLPEVFNLYKEYGKYLYDDYFLTGNDSLLDKVINLVENISPFFWVILDKETNKTAGFAFLSNVIGDGINYHCAEVTTCFKQEFWGKFTKKCAKKFIKYCFKKYRFKKLKATVFEGNERVKAILKLSGFKKEATLRGETLKCGKLQNVEIFSILRKKRGEK